MRKSKQCKFCHGSKKMLYQIGTDENNKPVHRRIRCLCDTEVRRKSAVVKQARAETGVQPTPALPPPDKQSVLMHQDGVTIRVEPREVAEGKAEGFRRYRAEPKGRKLSKKARGAAAKRQGKRVSRKPTTKWLTEKAKEALER